MMKQSLQSDKSEIIKQNILKSAKPLEGTWGHEYLKSKGIHEFPIDHGLLYNRYQDSHSIVTKLSDASVVCKYFNPHDFKITGYGIFGRPSGSKETSFYSFNHGSDLLLCGSLENALAAYQVTPNRDKYTFRSVCGDGCMQVYNDFRGFGSVTVIADNKYASIEAALKLKDRSPIPCKVFSTCTEATYFHDKLKSSELMIAEISR